MAGGVLGIQPQRDKGGMLCHSPASLLEGVNEVRSEVLSRLVGSRTKGRQQRWREEYSAFSRTMTFFFLPRPIGTYPVAAHKRLVRQPLCSPCDPR